MLRQASKLARIARAPAQQQAARGMSSGHSVEEEIVEMNKWRNIR
jgi:hypothetical protein